MNKFKDKSHYNTPMSICYVDKDHIYIAYHEIGAKTRGILKGDKLGIKGPYFNGIIGREKLSNIKNSNIETKEESKVANTVEKQNKSIEKEKTMIKGDKKEDKVEDKLDKLEKIEELEETNEDEMGI